MKELPKVYVNPLDKEFKNFQTTSETREYKKNIDKKNLSIKIKDIFNSNNYIYKKRVRITTENSTFEKYVVGRANGCLLTLDGERIKINDIYDIEIA